LGLWIRVQKCGPRKEKKEQGFNWNMATEEQGNKCIGFLKKNNECNVTESGYRATETKRPMVRYPLEHQGRTTKRKRRKELSGGGGKEQV